MSIAQLLVLGAHQGAGSWGRHVGKTGCGSWGRTPKEVTCLIFPHCAVTGLAAELGGIYFSLANTGSWGQLLGIPSLPDTNTVRSCSSRSQLWGRGSCDGHWELGRGAPAPVKALLDTGSIPCGILGFTGQDIKAESD